MLVAQCMAIENVARAPRDEIRFWAGVPARGVWFSLSRDFFWYLPNIWCLKKLLQTVRHLFKRRFSRRMWTRYCAQILIYLLKGRFLGAMWALAPILRPDFNLSFKKAIFWARCGRSRPYCVQILIYLLKRRFSGRMWALTLILRPYFNLSFKKSDFLSASGGDVGACAHTAPTFLFIF